MTRKQFIEQLISEYPDIQYSPESLDDYMETCHKDGSEPWTAMFAKYWAEY